MKFISPQGRFLVLFLLVMLFIPLVLALSDTQYYDYDPTKPFAKSISQFSEANGLDVWPFIRQPDGAKVLRYYDASGKLISQEVIPPGYEFSTKGNSLVISGKSAKALEVLGFGIDSSDAVTIKIAAPKGAGKTIELVTGTADITVGTTTFRGIRATKQFISPGLPLKNEPAVIRTNRDGDITYLKFNTVKQARYFLSYKGKQYDFYVRENSNVLFDPENGIISGDNADLTINSDGVRYEMDGAYTLQLDTNGNFKKVETRGSFEVDGQRFFSSEGTLNLVIDRDEFNTLNDEGFANLVLVEDKEIIMKGNINVESLDNSNLFYRGRRDSLTVFDREENKFHVTKGDALFGNGEYEVEILGGESFFKKVSDTGSPTLFSFDHENMNGVLEIGTITATGMKLEIIKDGKVFFNNDLYLALNRGTSTREIVLAELNEQVSAFKSKEYDRILGGLDKESPEWYKVYLEKLQNDGQGGMEFGDTLATKELFTDVQQRIKALQILSEKNPRSATYKQLLAQYYEHAGDILTQKLKDRGGRYEVKVYEGSDSSVTAQIKFNDRPGGSRFRTTSGKEKTSLQGSDVRGDTQFYERILGEQVQAASFYEKAQEFGIYFSEEELDLKKIDVLIAGGEYVRASQAAQSLANSGASDGVTSEAYAKLGASLFFYEGEQVRAHEAIDKAIKLDPTNLEALRIRNTFDHSKLSRIGAITSSEAERSFNDLKVITSDIGASTGTGWRYLNNFGVTIGSVHTTIARGTGLFGVATTFEEYQSLADKNIAESDRVGLAARQMRQLLESGVSLRDYATSSFEDKFLAVYASNNYDDIIPANELGKLFDMQQFQTAAPSEKLGVMLTLMKQERYNIDNPDLQSRFLATQRYMNVIATAADGPTRDKTLAALLYTGAYEPVKSIYGEKVTPGALEANILYFADIGANPLNFIGAGIAAKGASTAVKQSLKLSFLSARGLGKTYGSIAAKDLARAYALEVSIDAAATLSFESLAKINPELSKTLGLGIGILAGTAITGKAITGLRDIPGVKVYSDLSGTDFFVKNTEALKAFHKTHGGELFTKGGEQFLVSRIKGNTVKVRVPENLKNLYEVGLLNRVAILGRSELGRETQLALQDTLTETGRRPFRDDYVSEEDWVRRYHPKEDDLIYHSAQRASETGEEAYKFANARGLDSKDAQFVGEVGLVQDLDPSRKSGTPPRTDETVALIELGFKGEGELADLVQNRFGWSEREKDIAIAMIRRKEIRTAHFAPSDESIELYRQSLLQLNPEDRIFAFREGSILSEYVDKCSGYCVNGFDKTNDMITGLANELFSVRRQRPGFMNAPESDTSEFLRNGLLDFNLDQQLAAELGIPFTPITSDEVFSLLPASYAETLENNIQAFSVYDGYINNLGTLGKKVDERIIHKEVLLSRGGNVKRFVERGDIQTILQIPDQKTRELFISKYQEADPDLTLRTIDLSYRGVKDYVEVISKDTFGKNLDLVSIPGFNEPSKKVFKSVLIYDPKTEKFDGLFFSGLFSKTVDAYDASHHIDIARQMLVDQGATPLARTSESVTNANQQLVSKSLANSILIERNKITGQLNAQNFAGFSINYDPVKRIVEFKMDSTITDFQLGSEIPLRKAILEDSVKWMKEHMEEDGIEVIFIPNDEYKELFNRAETYEEILNSK
jgi:tetratricopeptide (TPR) repeat protein